MTAIIEDRSTEAPEDAVDTKVLSVLSPETKVISKTPHGKALWASCFKLEAILSDGKKERFFLKECPSGTDPGKWRMRGEYETAKGIYDTDNTFSPRPIAWDNYQSDPEQWFLLCTFHDLDDDMVDPVRFCAKLAHLHLNATSTDGRFGFSCQTSRAGEDWSDTWEECFTKLIRTLLKMEWTARGPDNELVDLSTHLLDTVIPRLLRPLESEGRHIKPSLCHGDLWYGNACTDLATNEPIIFDGKALYAHNEYELGDWYAARNRFGRAYFRAYQAHIPHSPPEEDFSGRNILYSLKFNIQASVSFTESNAFRSAFKDDIRLLVKKYPGPYPEYLPKY